MKSMVVISKRWNNPKISMIVTDEGISFCVELDDFIESIMVEMEKENVSLVSASKNVIEGIKNESRRIVK